MGALRAVIAAAAILAGSPAHADEVERWQIHIDEASARFGVPSAWIRKVMWAESRGRTQIGGVPIRSPKGAMGLMQLMPGTWAELRSRLALGNDPDNPRDNILAGTAYLREMYDRFGYPGLFAAYNAGPARYSASLTGRPLPAETRDYLAQVSLGVMADTGKHRQGDGAKLQPPSLFAILRGSGAMHREAALPEAVQSDTADQETDPLFAVRSPP
jgi:soluble lytic murein transglycosylase-like protein